MSLCHFVWSKAFSARLLSTVEVLKWPSPDKQKRSVNTLHSQPPLGKHDTSVRNKWHLCNANTMMTAHQIELCIRIWKNYLLSYRPDFGVRVGRHATPVTWPFLRGKQRSTRAYTSTGTSNLPIPVTFPYPYTENGYLKVSIMHLRRIIYFGESEFLKST